MCLVIVVILSARRKYFTIVLLYYKSIIYKPTNNPNQSIFLTMYPFTNTVSGPTASIETLDIFPTTLTTSLYITKSDLDNGFKSINNKITAMLDTIFDTKIKQYNKE